MSLADLEDRIEAIGKPRPAAELPHPWLFSGYYTLTFPCGTHKTIRVHHQKLGPFAGRRLVSLLIGPQNTDDYDSFGEIVPSESVVWVWKRFKGSRQEVYAGLLVSLARGEAIDGHELSVSRCCLRCNRVLTTPESIERGIGPECEKREAKGTRGTKGANSK